MSLSNFFLIIITTFFIKLIAGFVQPIIIRKSVTKMKNAFSNGYNNRTQNYFIVRQSREVKGLILALMILLLLITAFGWNEFSSELSWESLSCLLMLGGTILGLYYCQVWKVEVASQKIVFKCISKHYSFTFDEISMVKMIGNTLKIYCGKKKCSQLKQIALAIIYFYLV